MAGLSVLKYIVEKSVLQNGINHDDTSLNCNLLDIINVSRELEVVLDENEENPNVTNGNTPKINFSINSTKDKPANNDSEFFNRSSINLALENHSKSRRFDSRPMPYAFDNNRRKLDSLDDSTLSHVAHNLCGEGVYNFVRSNYDRESTGPQKDSLVVFLLGQIEFLSDEIKIKNNIIESLLTLKSTLHDNQLFSYNLQQIKKVNKNFVHKNVDTDYIPVDYQPLAQSNNMDILINKLNTSLNGIDESNEAINKIVVKQPIINPVESFYEISENRNFNTANLSQNIDFNISSGHSDKSHIENKSQSEILLSVN